jgi:hypothetical protein
MSLPPGKLRELITEAKKIFELLRDNSTTKPPVEAWGVLEPPAEARIWIDGEPVEAIAEMAAAAPERDGEFAVAR